MNLRKAWRAEAAVSDYISYMIENNSAIKRCERFYQNQLSLSFMSVVWESKFQE
jgi:hypothetical protein